MAEVYEDCACAEPVFCQRGQSCNFINLERNPLLKKTLLLSKIVLVSEKPSLNPPARYLQIFYRERKDVVCCMFEF